MALLTVDDFSSAERMYRIPAPVGENDTAEVVATIDYAEALFYSTFGLAEDEVADNEDYLEALKFFTYAVWLRAQAVMRTPIGVGAAQDLTQAEGKNDDEKFRLCWNRACALVGDEDNVIVPIINF